MVLNAWLISKHGSGRSGNWRKERLFHFKLSIARVLLQKGIDFTKPVLTPVQTTCLSDQSEDDHDVLLRKTKRSKRESKLSVSSTARYDGAQH